MPIFSSRDGTDRTYHLIGEGAPLICLPGGPMRASAYLGDLGGLANHRRLVLLDQGGTGGSAEPAEPASYGWDRLVDDVEALREHLGLDRIDLLAHSAGGDVAVLYAARHPSRVRKLALITPGTRTLGIPVTGGETADVVGSEGHYDPQATRAALADFRSPVLVLLGELDWRPGTQHAREFATLLPAAEVVVQPGGSHFPWNDDPGWFTATASAFLG